VAHGKVIQEINSGKLNQNSEYLSLKFDFEIIIGIWIAARCYTCPTQVAHTIPIIISINNKGVHNSTTIHNFLGLNEKYWKLN
jgi:hypothetical protein